MEWISVKDRLPEMGERVLVHDKTLSHIVGYIDVYGDWEIDIDDTGYTLELVDYWQPLPEPPK